MEQQGRRKKSRRDARPIDFLIKGVELAAVLEGIEDEGDQAENVKMHSARRIPAPDKNEHPDEEVEKSYYAEIILNP